MIINRFSIVTGEEGVESMELRTGWEHCCSRHGGDTQENLDFTVILCYYVML